MSFFHPRYRFQRIWPLWFISYCLDQIFLSSVLARLSHRCGIDLATPTGWESQGYPLWGSTLCKTLSTGLQAKCMHYKNVCRRDNTLSISNMRVGKRQRWAEVGCSVYSSIRGNGGWEREKLQNLVEEKIITRSQPPHQPHQGPYLHSLSQRKSKILTAR